MLGNYDGVCSVTAKEAYKKAQEIHSNLKATHCGFGGCTLVRDDDAFIFIESSFVEDLECSQNIMDFIFIMKMKPQ